MSVFSALDATVLVAGPDQLSIGALHLVIWLSQSLPLALRFFVILALQAPLRVVLGGIWVLPMATMSFALGTLAAPQIMPVELFLSPSWAYSLAAELLVGLIIGAVTSLPGYAFLGGLQTNWKVLLDSGLRGSSATLISCALLWATATGLGVHHMILDALVGSLAWLPSHSSSGMGPFAPWVAVGLGMVTLAQAAVDMCVLALGFAAPALVSTLVLGLGSQLLAATDFSLEQLSGLRWQFLRCCFVLLALASLWEVRSQGWVEAVFALG